jgi:hypothetical protein
MLAHGGLDSGHQHATLGTVEIADPEEVVWLWMYRRVRDVLQSQVALADELGIGRQLVNAAFQGYEDKRFMLHHLAKLVTSGKVRSSDLFKQLHDISWEMETGRVPGVELEDLRSRKAPKGPGPGRPTKEGRVSGEADRAAGPNAPVRHAGGLVHQQRLKVAEEHAEKLRAKKGPRRPTNRPHR